MHCAIHRVPPRVEYLELEPQPAAIKAYTDKDIQTRILRRERDQSQTGEEVMTKTQSKEGIMNIIKQAKRIRKGLAVAGARKGLESNFKASAKGVRMPAKNGLFGPRRNMI